jgi:hypothetical protein
LRSCPVATADTLFFLSSPLTASPPGEKATGRPDAGEKNKVFVLDMNAVAARRLRGARGMPNFETIRAAPSSNRHRIPEMGGANARRIFQNGLEHGLQFAWRTADYLEHFRCRGLLEPAYIFSCPS